MVIASAYCCQWVGGWVAGWLAGWLAGRPAGWLAGWVGGWVGLCVLVWGCVRLWARRGGVSATWGAQAVCGRGMDGVRGCDCSGCHISKIALQMRQNDIAVISSLASLSSVDFRVPGLTLFVGPDAFSGNYLEDSGRQPAFLQELG